MQHQSQELDGVIALGWYADPVLQALIRSWKYQYIRASEPEIEQLTSVWLGGGKVLPTGTWECIPIPLHPIRYRQRGFNQSAVWARQVSYELGVPCGGGLVRRRHYWRAQAELEHCARQARTMRVFGVRGRAPTDVLLVDDVYTTGRTLQAAAATLKAAGAKRVWGCVLARGN